MKINKLLPYIFLVILTSSCKKFTEVPLPPGQLANPLPFGSDAAATQVVAGIYSEMMTTANQFSSSLTTLYAGLAADELKYYTPSFRDEFYNNSITGGNHTNISNYFWKPAYRFIYATNAAIEGISASSSLTPAVKTQLMGESQFLRAFCFFNLANFFGEVPLTLSTDYAMTAQLPRASKENVYLQVERDLLGAIDNLDAAYKGSARVRPNKSAAKALLARLYLYKGEWQKAVNMANEVLGSNAYLLEGDPAAVFLKDSKEAIWQLAPANPVFNTFEGNAILPPTVSAAPTYIFTDTMVRSFETGDKRKDTWVGTRVYAGKTIYYPSKYRMFSSGTTGIKEHYVVLRAAEQYLIRAEAFARLGLLTESLNDLNKIRSRAGLAPILSGDAGVILLAIEQERKIELAVEWGHRWFDLGRTGKADAVLGGIKGANWQSTDVLWPVPTDQIAINPFLTQNAGY